MHAIISSCSICTEVSYSYYPSAARQQHSMAMHHELAVIAHAPDELDTAVLTGAGKIGGAGAGLALLAPGRWPKVSP